MKQQAIWTRLVIVTGNHPLAVVSGPCLRHDTGLRNGISLFQHGVRPITYTR